MFKLPASLFVFYSVTRTTPCKSYETIRRASDLCLSLNTLLPSSVSYPPCLRPPIWHICPATYLPFETMAGQMWQMISTMQMVLSNLLVRRQAGLNGARKEYWGRYLTDNLISKINSYVITIPQMQSMCPTYLVDSNSLLQSLFLSMTLPAGLFISDLLQ